ncbi:BspA family leucine-rich repeat surface protein, partial [Candidatus Ruminimicrobium bovinum]|uniref:BspA family leucine-rich repeat surface protein n=1 Tax=Candidatus Ruminimicrobium bovinum TaxID=3242779 RepID=UPI0039B91612
YCQSLKELNLSNFDTSIVANMGSMFGRCSKLTSLDISNFNTSLVKQMQQMFFGSINLGYINLYNFDENNLNGYTYYYQNMFNKIPENVVVCIIRNFTEMKIFPKINKKINIFYCIFL